MKKSDINNNRELIGKYYDFDNNTWDMENLQQLGIPLAYKDVLAELGSLQS